MCTGEWFSSFSIKIPVFFIRCNSFLFSREKHTARPRDYSKYTLQQNNDYYEDQITDHFDFQLDQNRKISSIPQNTPHERLRDAEIKRFAIVIHGWMGTYLANTNNRQGKYNIYGKGNMYIH